MSFASPLYLAALALVPLALIAQLVAWRRARRYAVRFPGVATLAPLVPRIPSWRRQAPLALFLAALAAFAFALARPQATVAVPREQATIVLVTDVSRSMLADDVEPSRIEAAREAAQRFLEELPDEARVGAVAFSTDPHTVEAPTDDHRRIADLIDALAADGGTATGDALDTALKLVDGPVKKRPPAAIVLLSDGETTTGRDPVEVARVAKRLKIPIHTVALGTREGVITLPDGALIPVAPDPETMRRIAELSGGRSFAVEDADDLSGLYRDLGSRVATKKEEREITGVFAAGGGLLLMGAAAFGVRAAARLP
jgi:Ca-activated chloride channel homolog